SVRVDEVIGVAGFVLPGTRVDVLMTITPQGENRTPITRIILQNIQTLASGQTIQRDANGTPQTVSVVTLLVTPEQAEALTLASKEGRIQLALRHTLYVRIVDTDGIRAAALLRDRTTQRASTAAVRVTPTTSSPTSNTLNIEVIRGGERTINSSQ